MPHTGIFLVEMVNCFLIILILILICNIAVYSLNLIWEETSIFIIQIN